MASGRNSLGVLLKYSDRFELTCNVDGCTNPGVVLATTDIMVVARAAFDLGWQERVRKGGVTKSHHACPNCVAKLRAIAKSSMGHSTGTHGPPRTPRG